MSEQLPLLSVRELTLSLSDLLKPPLWSKPVPGNVLKNINLELNGGETLGIVGESGSGKTTLGRCVLRLVKPTEGHVLFAGTDITRLSQRKLRPLRANMQMIFQDPMSSLNPRRRVGASIAQPLRAFGHASNDIAASVHSALERVGLGSAFIDRYPHELSGGQRQRVGIARAIALQPRLVIADEIVSGLDVSSQATILALLRELKEELGLALIFISHDLSVVRSMCDDVLVLRRGRAVEQNNCEQVFGFPCHPYTRELIAAIPTPDVDPDWLNHTFESHEFGGIAMKVKDSTALVTGANRGIGKCFVEALVARGAKKVYACGRKQTGVAGLADKYPGVVEAVELDITDHEAITNVAGRCSDVSLLINNAGVNQMSAFAASDSIDGARQEMEVNYFGTLAMSRAFATVLSRNGGGAMINMLSILSRVNLPLMGSLCASKAAGLSLVQGLRAELDGQGTAVVAVMPGAVDTDMSKDFPPPKMPPAEV
ncbi:MAG: SDR family NAD(P)-dependent oxidoreductase, partial [Pseudomonadota bacterium]